MYGPQEKTDLVRGPGQYGDIQVLSYKHKKSYRMGSKRRDTPLPYFIISAESPYGTIDAFNSRAYNFCSGTGGHRVKELASNQARERWVRAYQEGAKSSLGTTLAEWKQSEDMIVKRVGQIIKSMKCVRRADFIGAAQALGCRKPPGLKQWRRYPKGASNVWLEYHFGWSPLIGDIFDAVNVLQSPRPSNRFFGKGGYQDRETISRGSYDWSYDIQMSAKVMISSWVEVSNPNLHRANQLGLINPVGLAWELVPFSFVVDWFLPVGKFIDSFSDSLGYAIKKPFTATLLKAENNDMYKQSEAPILSMGRSASFRRELGIPPFYLRPPPFKGFSLARGATAISLLLQNAGNLQRGWDKARRSLSDASAARGTYTE